MKFFHLILLFLSCFQTNFGVNFKCLSFYTWLWQTTNWLDFWRAYTAHCYLQLVFENLFDFTSTNQIQLFLETFLTSSSPKIDIKSRLWFLPHENLTYFLSSSLLCFLIPQVFFTLVLFLCNKFSNTYHQQVLWQERRNFWCVIYNTMPNIRNNLPKNSWNDIPI